MIVKNRPINKLYNIEPLRVLHSSELKSSEKDVLNDITTIFNEGLPYFRSNTTIANLLSDSRHTIIRSISALKKKQWIKTGRAKDLKELNLRNPQARVVIAINAKKIFGQPFEIVNGKENDFIDYKHLAKWLKGNRGSKMELGKNSRSNNKQTSVKEEPVKKPKDIGGKLSSSKMEPAKSFYNNNEVTNNHKLVPKSNSVLYPKSNQQLVPKWNSSNIKHSNTRESNNNKMLHVQSSKSKSKNSNKDHDDSLASINVHSISCLNSTGLNKAGAQAHLARRDSSKHSSIFSNSKYKAIDSMLHDAFPNFDELVTRKSYERKCISSWLNGNRRLGTPSFSMSEIENAIDKAKKYNQQSSRPVLEPLALVYNILQTTNQEQITAKTNQQKYQNKKSKASNASSKSFNSPSSSSDSDPTEAAEVKDLSNGSDNEDYVYSQTIFNKIHTTLIPYFEEVLDNDSYDKASKEFVELQDYIKKHVTTIETFSYASEQFEKFSLPKCEKQKKNPVKVIEKLCVKN